MKKWMGGIRGSILVVVLWVIGWGLGFGGIMELVDPDGEIQDVWPTLLAVPGLIGGVVFAVLLAIERPGSFNDLSLFRFAVLGAVTGVVLGLFSIVAEVGDVSPGGAGMIVLAISLSTVAGLGAGAFFKLIARWRTDGGAQ